VLVGGLVLPHANALQSSAKSPEKIDFIQITDLHLFDAAEDAPSNQAALAWSLSVVRWYRDHHVNISFLAFTGDVGLNCVDDPRALPVEHCLHKIPLSQAADVLATFLAPVGLPVYFVPGNNDLVREKACDIIRYRDFVTALNDRLRQKGSTTTAIDLTAKPQQISGLLLMGLNSASFKAQDNFMVDHCPEAAKSEPIAASAVEELSRFSELVRSRGSKSTPVLVFTHEPEIVDPFRMTLTWYLRADQLREWHQLLCGDAITALFAGHFHAQNFRLYGSPIRTTSAECQAGTSASTWVAPPLAAKVQNPLAPEARGLLWVRVRLTQPYDVSVTPLWYTQSPVSVTAQPNNH
jgi:predicted MPP superfamily phosphohydrolase